MEKGVKMSLLTCKYTNKNTNTKTNARRGETETMQSVGKKSALTCIQLKGEKVNEVVV